MHGFLSWMRCIDAGVAAGASVVRLATEPGGSGGPRIVKSLPPQAT
jgi:hypothetical protein